jgi:ribosomal protein L11 methyltransferase
MDYAEVKLNITPFKQQDADILAALLADIGFESFSDTSTGFNAYIQLNKFEKVNLESFLKNLPFIESEVSFTSTIIKDQNWNKQWESNFDPITVENLCRIRAPFHQSEKGFDLEILIEPKMAFGTGHHQTTWLMIREMFNIDLKNKSVLDMGCGTGILAIVAEKLGATNITAIDNDNWAFENTKENIVANQCSKIKVLHGDASCLGSEKFDVILANINLNILIADIEKYVNCINNNGLLIMSGIFITDIPKLSGVAQNNGLNVILSQSRNDWALLLTKKSG